MPAATSFGLAGAIIICRFVLLGYSNLACLLSLAASAFKVADGEKAESESKSVDGHVEVFPAACWSNDKNLSSLYTQLRSCLAICLFRAAAPLTYDQCQLSPWNVYLLSSDVAFMFSPPSFSNEHT